MACVQRVLNGYVVCSLRAALHLEVRIIVLTTKKSGDLLMK